MDENQSSQAAGPGAIENQGEEPKPILDGATEYEYVDIFNPLTVTFIGQFGTTTAANSPVRINYSSAAEPINKTESQIATAYGLNLRNPDHPGKRNFTQPIELKAGETKRLLGNEAQVLVRQLVNEILSRRNNKLLMADAFARNEVEREIVRGRGLLTDILGAPPKTIQEQFKAEVNDDATGRDSQATTVGERTGFSAHEDSGFSPKDDGADARGTEASPATRDQGTEQPERAKRSSTAKAKA